MEFVNEVTAHLENKPGRLAKICSALASAKVNIHALSVMDVGERSVLRLVAEPIDETRAVLTSLGVEAEVAEVIAVIIDNKPGALSRLLEHLAEAHVNIEYAYTSAAGHGKALGIFHTDNPKKASHLLAPVEPPGNSDGRDTGRRPLHAR